MDLFPKTFGYPDQQRTDIGKSTIWPSGDPDVVLHCSTLTRPGMGEDSIAYFVQESTGRVLARFRILKTGYEVCRRKKNLWWGKPRLFTTDNRFDKKYGGRGWAFHMAYCHAKKVFKQ